ncbi:hypothetical protein DFQ26_001964, partial [Actinomortierella ambigua]
ALDRLPNDLERAKAAGCQRLDDALARVKDPIVLMQYFAQGRDTLEFSSRLMHRWPTDNHSQYRLEWASKYVAEKIAALLTQDACTSILKKLIENLSDSASGIMFEAYVHHVFRKGGHVFQIRALEAGESSESSEASGSSEASKLEIRQGPEIAHFDTISSAEKGTLCIPKIRNFACVDLLLAPRDLLQITVSQKHPIKGAPLSNLVESLVKCHWIPSADKAQAADEPRLIFVVPGDIYDSFKKQNYVTKEGTVYREMPVKVQVQLQRVKQYVLKIDLESAAAGKSPGLQEAGHQEADMKE